MTPGNLGGLQVLKCNIDLHVDRDTGNQKIPGQGQSIDLSQYVCEHILGKVSADTPLFNHSNPFASRAFPRFSYASTREFGLHGLCNKRRRELQINQCVFLEGAQHATNSSAPTTQRKEPRTNISFDLATWCHARPADRRCLLSTLKLIVKTNARHCH